MMRSCCVARKDIDLVKYSWRPFYSARSTGAFDDHSIGPP